MSHLYVFVKILGKYKGEILVLEIFGAWAPKALCNSTSIIYKNIK